MAEQKKDFRKIKKGTLENPRVIIIFSFPKVGKTEALTKLKDNYIFDFDNSLGFYDAIGESYSLTDDPIKVLTKFNKDFTELLAYVKENGKFQFTTIDTVTSFYDKLANTIAIINYNKAKSENKPLDFDITTLEYGIGYTYKRDAVKKLITKVSKIAETVIVIAHISDKSVNKDSGGIEVADMDLEGKLKNVLALSTDAIGLFYRKKDNTNNIKFVHNNSITTGSRIKRLRGKDITVSELQEDGVLKTYWENIFKL